MLFRPTTDAHAERVYHREVKAGKYAYDPNEPVSSVFASKYFPKEGEEGEGGDAPAAPRVTSLPWDQKFATPAHQPHAPQPEPDVASDRAESEP
jgi:hypothetical protein